MKWCWWRLLLVIVMFSGLSYLQAVVAFQAVIGSHHHVALTPLPVLVKVQKPIFIENLPVLSHFLLVAGTQCDLQGFTLTLRATL